MGQRDTSSSLISAALELVDSDVREIQRQRARALDPFLPPKVLIEACEGLPDSRGIPGRSHSSSRLQVALSAWHSWETGTGGIPAPVLLRTLCWELEVVSHERFLPCLEALRPLRSRELHALLPQYIRLWRPEARPDEMLRRALSEGLAAVAQPRGHIERWQAAASELFTTDAPEALAAGAVEKGIPVRSRLEELGLATDTEFARCAAVASLKRASAPPLDSDRIERLLETVLPADSPIAGDEGWGPALANLILDPTVAATQPLQERVLDFSLRDLALGDPRVSPVPWKPVGAAATREVIRWRSSEDLRFFFDLVMKGQPDHQGRHRFWLQYVDGVTRSMIVLCQRDRERIRRHLQDLQDRGRRFVKLEGSNDTSAFIMEFGSVVVVEFSKAGNACFLYQEPKGSDFISWNASTTALSRLKNQRRAKERMSHFHGWENKFANSLARRGVRPTPKEKRRL